MSSVVSVGKGFFQGCGVPQGYAPRRVLDAAADVR
jgi:hypothetical protein